jgi:peptide/nickel transport system substrate-binding protein
MRSISHLYVRAILLTCALGCGAFGQSTLVVCDGTGQPPTLDPHREFTEKTHTIVQQIFDGLVQFNPDGKIEPALAKRWQRMGPKRMRFHLRKGVTFHNGEPFNAQAVKFSLQRYRSPQIDFPAIGFLGSIAEVKIIDNHTVDIVTRYPDGLLLDRLAAFVWIVPPEYVKQNGQDILKRQPVGTGAFEFQSWKPGDKIVLTANEHYWQEGLPHLDRLVFRFVPADKQVDLLLKGEVDLVTELPGTMTTRVEGYPDTRVLKERTFWTVGATMRMRNGPLADIRVRKALNYAIDREALIRYDVRGNGAIIASLTMDGQEGHNATLDAYPHDPGKARKLLEQAGVKLPLELRTLVREQAERTARILAAQLEKIGVKLSIDAVASDAKAMKLLAEPAKWDLAIASVPDPMAHPYFSHSLLLFSKSPFSLYQSRKFDRRLLQMVRTLDRSQRRARMRKIDAYVHEKALSLFTYQKIKTYGVQANVQFTPYVTGMPYFFAVRRETNSSPGDQQASPTVIQANQQPSPKP